MFSFRDRVRGPPDRVGSTGCSVEGATSPLPPMRICGEDHSEKEIKSSYLLDAKDVDSE